MKICSLSKYPLSLSLYSFIKLSISYWTLNSWCNNIHTCLKRLDCWRMSVSSYILTKIYLCSSASSLHSFLYMKSQELDDLEEIIKTVWRINSLGLPLNCYSKKYGAVRLCVVIRMAKLFIVKDNPDQQLMIWFIH